MTPHPPIRRHPALRPLTRDHHVGLLHARHLREAAAGRRDPERVAQEFDDAWTTQLADHLVEEERLLIPLIPDPAHAERLRNEHEAIRSMAAGVRGGDRDPGPLRRLGDALNDHIRWEERELFFAIEAAATALQMERLARQTDEIERRRPRHARLAEVQAARRRRAQKGRQREEESAPVANGSSRDRGQTMATPNPDAPAITPDTMLPDLIRRYPNTRPVFDRYGLRGCGGRFGPPESVEYFARVHGVDLGRLLAELNQAACAPPARQPAPDPLDELADSIYRRFFKAGIVAVLTAGALWGAVLLLRIGAARSFTAISIHEVNAHGHAQIFGWVGLFVMGFAYQAFPRMRHTNLWRPDLANVTFYLMVFGVFARAVGEPLFDRAFLRALAAAAGVAEIAAVGLFVTILLRTFAASGKPVERHDAYVLAAMAFFLVQGVYDLGLFWATTSARSRAELLRIVATCQAPLRDLQIHGFAMLMIFGVAIRMFPALFGMAAPGARLVNRCFVLLVLGVIGEGGFFIAMRRTGNPLWAMPMYGAVLLLVAGSLALTARWGLLARPTERDRSIKFLRAAVAWLHVSMVMLLLLPVYTRVVLPAVPSLSETGRQGLEIGFSHAFYGAVRHAITVGFISLTILGMAAKVVPTLNGVDVRRLRGLWTPFVLVNVGCFMRVAFQIGTEFGDWSWPIAGASGLLEVTGIAIWAAHLWRLMARPQQIPRQDEAQRPARITPDLKVGHVLDRFPETLPVFDRFGFAPLRNPAMRRTVAAKVTLAQAARIRSVDLEGLVEALNAAIHSTREESTVRRA